jgi:hypothetical protein
MFCYRKIILKTLPVILLFLVALPIRAQQSSKVQKETRSFNGPDVQDNRVNTGPEVGETIPHFEAMDRTGKRTGLQDIVGSKGAVILFYRSADW